MLQAKLSKLIKKYFPNDDLEIMEYGLYVLISKIIFMTTIIITGIFFDELVSVILFTLFYTPIRSFAGGIHAETPSRCYVLSLIMLISVAVFSKYVLLPRYIVYTISIISFALIAGFAPVETQNKPLDDIEIKVYGKRTLILSFAELVIGIVFEVLSFKLVLNNVMLAFVVINVMLISGMIKNQLTKNNDGGNNEN